MQRRCAARDRFRLGGLRRSFAASPGCKEGFALRAVRRVDPGFGWHAIPGEMTSRSVRDSELTWHDGPRASQPTQPGKVADKRQDAEEHAELDGVEDPVLREDLPHEPQHGLRPADGPDRSVEVAAFVSLALRR